MAKKEPLSIAALQQENQDFEVHTMPEKFLSLRSGFKIGKKTFAKLSKPTNLKKNLIIGIIVITILGGLMALAAWLFLRSLDQPPATSQELDTQSAGDIHTLDQQPIEPEQPAQLDELPAANQALLDFDAWLSFDNPTYKYTLQYPHQWLLSQSDAPDMLEFVVFKDQDQTERFSISLFSNPNRQPLLDWLTVNLNIDQEDLESFSLHSYSAHKYENTLLPANVVYILFDQNIYSLSFPITDDNVLNQVYAQLLINFKFDQLAEFQEPAPEFIPAADTDKDNLTDAEEAIYGTHKNRRDTDNDSYIDGDEVANLYDPTSPGSARLHASPLVSTYLNSAYNYNIIHPASWTVKGINDSIIFQDPNGEFIQVLITQNDQGFIDIKEWYQMNINPDISGLSDITVDTQPAIRTPDSMQVYFIFGDHVYSLIYNIGLRTDFNFITTFDMMIKSFKLMNIGN